MLRLLRHGGPHFSATGSREITQVRAAMVQFPEYRLIEKESSQGSGEMEPNHDSSFLAEMYLLDAYFPFTPGNLRQSLAAALVFALNV